MGVSVYLTYDGCTREAFEFYAKAIDAKIEYVSTWDEAPNASELSEEQRAMVMHASLKVGDTGLMASDRSHTCPGEPLVQGENFSLCLDTKSPTQTDEWLARLSEGGKVTVPAEDTFWGAYFAMCTDKFGISWMFVCDSTGEQEGN